MFSLAACTAVAEGGGPGSPTRSVETQPSGDGPANTPRSTSSAESRSGQPSSSPGPKDFVYRQGRHLMLNGRPYKFTGMNIYNATSDDSHPCWYSMGTQDLVELALDQI